MSALLLVLASLLLGHAHSDGILYPRASETRQILSLDGLWNFAVNAESQSKKWHPIDLHLTSNLDVQKAAVPSSYNDLSADADIRDYVGIVSYQRNVVIPRFWQGQNVWIRFSSVTRAADVWINGELAIRHEFGHLPFQADVTSLINFGSDNNITVAVDNRLLSSTIPQGSVSTSSSGRLVQSYNFDYFNYAGIDRPVVLYSTADTYINDITVRTTVTGSDAVVDYEVVVEGPADVISQITLLDRSGQEVDSGSTLTGTINVSNATLWWPYLMDPNPGYLYSLQVELLDASGSLVDKYVLPVGIRTITWDNKSVNINGKPLYLRGFGSHEDVNFKGKGLDLPSIVRDYNLIRWLGANVFRTANYPYAEETMDLADQNGILVIDESPAVSLDQFSTDLLSNHTQAITELVQRDKNRPSVIIWSAGNEPNSASTDSADHFQQIIDTIRTLDPTRPVTFSSRFSPDVDVVAPLVDIASFNILEGWTDDIGDLDLITATVTERARQWNQAVDKPVLLTAYGADSDTALHFLPSYVWSEDFQEDFLAQYFQAFDQLRSEGFFIGELVWNFADYITRQDYSLPGGSRKGLFTRDRQPKAAAYLVRQRFWALAQNLDNATVPDDLNPYIVSDV